MIDVSATGLAAAALAGLVSFASPCVLPLIPGYIAYVSGATGEETRSGRFAALGPALFFVLGFSTLFVLLGLSAQALGGVLQRHADVTNVVGGALIMGFGLLTTGLVRVPVLLGEYRWSGPAGIRGPEGAYLLGVAFAFGWTPCIGPILASILVVTATSAGAGAALLGAYSLGLGVPFLLTAIFIGEFRGVMGPLRRFGRAAHLAAGVVMIAMGALIMTGRLQWIAIYLLEAFPILGRIG